MVGLILEEHMDEVWKLLQLVYLIIYRDILVQLLQQHGIFLVSRFFDDYLLAEDVALDAQTQQLHEEVLVYLHVEHCRVVGCLVGHEDGYRREHGWCQTLTEPDGP